MGLMFDGTAGWGYDNSLDCDREVRVPEGQEMSLLFLEWRLHDAEDWVAVYDVGKAVVLTPSEVRVLVLGSNEFFDYHESQRGRVRLRYIVQGDGAYRGPLCMEVPKSNMLSWCCPSYTVSHT